MIYFLRKWKKSLHIASSQTFQLIFPLSLPTKFISCNKKIWWWKRKVVVWFPFLLTFSAQCWIVKFDNFPSSNTRCFSCCSKQTSYPTSRRFLAIFENSRRRWRLPLLHWAILQRRNVKKCKRKQEKSIMWKIPFQQPQSKWGNYAPPCGMSVSDLSECVSLMSIVRAGGDAEVDVRGDGIPRRQKEGTFVAFLSSSYLHIMSYFIILNFPISLLWDFSVWRRRLNNHYLLLNL